MSYLPQIRTEPDFRHIKVWIFDLDNTLYPADCGLFAQIDRRMTEFVVRTLEVDWESARATQKRYYREHGTTLNGLVKLHAVDPEDYLAFVHDVDLSALVPDSRLGSAFARLNGQRVIFTNGCSRHANRVLARLNLSSYFDDIWDIRTGGFCPKPDPGAFDAVLGRASIIPERAAMFDDAARNLVPARALGMTTVWVRNASEWSSDGPTQPIALREHINHETDDLAGFLHAVRVQQ